MTELQPGDLLWTRSAGVVGALIRFGERIHHHGWRSTIARAVSTVVHARIPEDPMDLSWGNHIAVYVGDNQVIEALADGLTLDSLDHYGPDKYRPLPLAAVRADATDVDRARLVAFARRELADKDRYGWLAIASIVVQLLTPLRLDVSVDGTMICSAFGARCWEHAGVIIPTRSPYTTFPSDLALLALKGAA
ncbi:MAG TPA: hypothetical protein VHT75_04415 [Acidimicrobiales bacterium]|nr:hypothetical protein [Acidimicrobiales bacterium]